MSYTKLCNKCGQRISLREMRGGQWVAFDVNTDKVHKHSKKQGKVKKPNKYKIIIPCIIKDTKEASKYTLFTFIPRGYYSYLCYSYTLYRCHCLCNRIK